MADKLTDHGGQPHPSKTCSQPPPHSHAQLLPYRNYRIRLSLPLLRLLHGGGLNNLLDNGDPEPGRIGKRKLVVQPALLGGLVRAGAGVLQSIEVVHVAEGQLDDGVMVADDYLSVQGRNSNVGGVVGVDATVRRRERAAAELLHQWHVRALQVFFEELKRCARLAVEDANHLDDHLGCGERVPVPKGEVVASK